MKREDCTKKLVRTIERIEAGTLSATIKELYVFGSYARGAIEPGDLDIVVVYEDPGPDYWKKERTKAKYAAISVYQAALTTWHEFRTRLADALRSRGERIDLVLASSLEDVTEGNKAIQPGDLVRVWSAEDRNWREKLERLTPDAAAGRAPRSEIFPLKRLRDDCATMQEVVDLIAAGEVLLTRIPVAELDLKLDLRHEAQLGLWKERKLLGKELARTMPYALRWLESCGERCGSSPRTEVWSKTKSHRVEMGRPSLAEMLFLFRTKPKLQRQCLIPYFKQAGPNKLLVFERGPAWKQACRKK
ncbi:MAG: nucleotidyltransferase domain-containing protein [Pirellulales bacterium]